MGAGGEAHVPAAAHRGAPGHAVPGRKGLPGRAGAHQPPAGRGAACYLFVSKASAKNHEPEILAQNTRLPRYLSAKHYPAALVLFSRLLVEARPTTVLIPHALPNL